MQLQSQLPLSVTARSPPEGTMPSSLCINAIELLPCLLQCAGQEGLGFAHASAWRRRRAVACSCSSRRPQVAACLSFAATNSSLSGSRAASACTVCLLASELESESFGGHMCRALSAQTEILRACLLWPTIANPKPLQILAIALIMPSSHGAQVTPQHYALPVPASVAGTAKTDSKLHRSHEIETIGPGMGLAEVWPTSSRCTFLQDSSTSPASLSCSCAVVSSRAS